MKTTFPEDLSVLSVEDLETLRVDGLTEFDLLYPAEGDGQAAAFAALPAESVKDLSDVTTGLDRVTGELATRAEKAATLAAMGASREKFGSTITINSGTLDADIDDDSAGPDSEDVIVAAGGDTNPAALSAETEVPAEAEPVAFASGAGLGVAIDSPLDWDGVGKALDHQLRSFNSTPYAEAARNGNKRPLKQVQNFARFTKKIDPELMLSGDDSNKGVVRKAIEKARDTKRLKGGSLIASGGWGAPSQISYDRFRKLSSRDGLATFPEIGVEHGGLQLPTGSDFAAVYASPDFIAFTEQQDIDGDYAPGSGGNLENPPINIPNSTKPVYRIPATTWADHRLKVDGIHVQAGILENRGYPEGIAAEVAQVLDAHAHVINAKVIAEVASGSTHVSFAANQAGSVAPVLSAVDLQILHYRDTHRMTFGEELETKFPNWLKAAFRADLSRRMGVDLLDVADSRIEGWFTERGAQNEWVYDWQSIAATAATAFLAPPATVNFLLYAAGTWVKGVEPVISLDTMYDSTLLGTNDYTLMFTEEGWFVAKAGTDSRLVTVPLNSNGATNIGMDITNAGVGS